MGSHPSLMLSPPPFHTTHRFVFFFLPLLIIECYNLTVYRIVSRAVSQTLARDTVFSRIKRYILVSLVCKGLALAKSAHAYFVPLHPAFVLYLVARYNIIRACL